jgi:hypothetical protein
MRCAVFCCGCGCVVMLCGAVSCWSGSHYALIAFSSFIALIYLISIPFVWFLRARRLLVFAASSSTAGSSLCATLSSCLGCSCECCGGRCVCRPALGDNGSHASAQFEAAHSRSTATQHRASLAHVSGSAAHELYLQSRELEYVLGVNAWYETLHFSLIAPFTREWSYERVYVCAFKAVLGGVVYVLGPYGLLHTTTVPTPEVQAIVFLVCVCTCALSLWLWLCLCSALFCTYPFLCVWCGAVVLCCCGLWAVGCGLWLCRALQYCAWAVAHLYTPAYRTPHTNQLAHICHTTIAVQCLIGLFSAAQFRSALLVASNLRQLLFGVNGTGLCAVALVLGWVKFKAYRM